MGVQNVTDFTFGINNNTNINLMPGLRRQTFENKKFNIFKVI